MPASDILLVSLAAGYDIFSELIISVAGDFFILRLLPYGFVALSGDNTKQKTVPGCGVMAHG